MASLTGTARSRFSAGRWAYALAVGVLFLILGLAYFSYFIASEMDDARARDQSRALRAALEKSHNMLGEFSNWDRHSLRLLERVAGVKNLRLEDGQARGDGLLQSVVDRKGRIVGWLSFTPDRPATAYLKRMLPFGSVAVLAFAGIAGIFVFRLRRSDALLRDSEEYAREIRQTDALTGLPAHHTLMQQLDALMASRAPGATTVIAYIDLDRFGEICNSYGYETANEVLVAFSQRLHESIPKDAICGRTWGDEFIIAANVEDPAAYVSELTDLADALCRPVWLAGRAIQIGLSAGVVYSPLHGQVRDELLRRSDLAVGVSKARGRGRVTIFQPPMDIEFSDRRKIEYELKTAIANDQLDLHYQPIVEAGSGNIVGVEALLRWTHPEHGPIAPQRFVAIAEQAGFMDALGEFVLRRALSDIKRWPQLYVAVNVSPLQVRNRRLVDVVARQLMENGVSPSRLLLEVTESVLIDDPDEASARINALRALGVRIALDDFGTGYASLGYLQRFSFDKLKIDKSFVAPLGRSETSGAMIQAIISLGNALGMTILAEGVETEEQRVLLRLAGCHEMQGFLFARPEARDRIDALLGSAPSKSSSSTNIAY